MFTPIGPSLINAVSFGSSDVVLGVGGWIGNWELWQQPFELLSADGYRTIAYDHYGAGETVAPSELATFEGQVQAVFQILDHYDIGRCVLAGESNGGTVALAAAARHPERFRGVIVVDAATNGFDNDRTRGFVEALRSDHAGSMGMFVDFCIPEPDADHLKR